MAAAPAPATLVGHLDRAGRTLARGLGVGPADRLEPVRLAATLAAVAAATLPLAADRSAAAVAAAVLLVCLVPLLLTAHRLRLPVRLLALTTPVLVAAAPGALALAGHPDPALLVLPALAASYLGLCARPGDTLRALPVLTASAVLVLPADRVALVAAQLALWIVVGEVVARTRRGFGVLLADSRRAAETDPLTGLGNRRRLDAALRVLPLGGVVVVVDLDHFKTYNDRWGHPAGDGLLVRFAAVLRAVVGEGAGTASACRFGGEEFVIVVPDPTDAATLFARLRSAWQATAPAITFSAGLAARRPAEDAGTTLARADAALFEAKGAGRNREVGPYVVPVQRRRSGSFDAGRTL